LPHLSNPFILKIKKPLTMAKFKTNKDFSKYSDLEVVEKIDVVIVKLTGNPNFVTPSPTLIVLTTLRNEYYDAIIAASSGGPALVAAKNEKRAEVEAALYNEGVYVDLNGLNTESIMLSSGFDVYSTVHGVAPASETPFVKSAVDGMHSGECVVKSNTVKNAVVYELRHTKDEFGPEAIWERPPAQTKTTFLVTGLTPGRLYWIQIRTISTKGPSGWSDPYQFMVR
jgi:hypothetical protein